MRKSVIDVVVELATEDSNLWLVTADLGYSVLEPFAEQFPERFVNVGVAEQNMMGLATGLALSGKRVVAYSIANFATLRCLEQIRNDVIHHNADVKIIAVGAGYAYGAQGHTHYGLADHAVMSAIGGIDVITPADPLEARLAARAMFEWPGPAYMRLGRSGEAILHVDSPNVVRGQKITCRDGEDVLIIANGSVLSEALAAAAELEGEGLNCAVWSMPWVNPLDCAAVEDAGKRYRLIITVEEGVPNGGLASAVASILATISAPRARQVFAAADDTGLPASITQASARKALQLDAESLAKRIFAEMKVG